MDIKDFFPLYPSQNDPSIQSKLASKGELQEVKSQSKEEVKKGQVFYYNHQKAFERVMRIYKTMFLFGRTGTGKTGSFARMARYFQKNKNLGFYHAYFITSNDLLKDEFKRQLAVQFPPEKGVEEGKRKNKFFTVTTYRAFAGYLKKKYYVDKQWKYNGLKEELEHSIFFIDEVHKLRKEEQDIEESEDSKLVNIVETRNIFQDIFHRLQFIKLVVASGTPMINDPSDIIELVNLVLPMNRQIPIDTVLEDMTIDAINKYFGGYIYFVEALDTGITRVIEGENIKGVKLFKVNMSDFQYKSYLRVKGGKEEKEEDERQFETSDSFVAKSRQAATFVFPNGLLGQFNKYFTQEIIGKTTKGRGRKDQVTSYTHYKFAEPFFQHLGEEMNVDLQDLTYEEKMEALNKVDVRAKLKAVGKLSAIFASTIDIELKSSGCAFANDVHTKASGVLVFSKILELFGFSPFEERLNPTEEGKIKPTFVKKLRYAVLTSETPRLMKNFMMDIWNHPDNYDGSYIKLFITSPTGDTGINLSHVQRIYSFPSPWNLSSQHQTETRAIRSTSHSVLLSRLGLKNVPVHIYYFYACGPNNEETAGLKLYLDAAVKDKKIKKVEEMLKKVAINAIYDKERNGIVPYNKEMKEIDYSNYDTTYADELVEQCSNDLQALYRLKGYYHIYEIEEKLKQYRKTIISRTLSLFLNTQRTLVNKYNFPCLLREYNNCCILVQNFDNPSYLQGLGFYDNLIITHNKEINPLDINEEEAKEVSSPFFALAPTQTKSYVESLLDKPSQLIALLEESINKKIEGEENKNVDYLLNRFRFSWYRCKDYSDEVEADKGKKRKIVAKMSEEEIEENNKGNIYIHILSVHFAAVKEAGYIDTVRNPIMEMVKYRDPKDKVWKKFTQISDYLPYNSFIQRYQNYYLQKYEPVYAIVARDSDPKNYRIVDVCKRTVKGKGMKGGEDARLTSKGRLLRSYPTEDIIDAIYNCAPSTLLEEYKNMAHKVVSKGGKVNEELLDKTLNQKQYKASLSERSKFKYDSENNYDLDRKLFRLGFYNKHIKDKKEAIDNVLLKVLKDSNHILDWGLTKVSFGGEPKKVGNPCP